jgi:hypothetical protein
MADVTGKIYECFTEHLLRRLGWAPGPDSGMQKEFLYERDVPARCHTSASICANARECTAFSEENSLPYGPWYDPDFFLTVGGIPYGCIHVTHWSNESTSQRKFWRTMEDHLQYKTMFGADFISMSFVFVALEPGQKPRMLQDSRELVQLQGWRPATGTMLATSFDASLLFPVAFQPLQAFATTLPGTLPKMNASARREYYNAHWDGLVSVDSLVKRHVRRCERLMREAIGTKSHPRYSAEGIAGLQDVCWRGRQLAAGSRTTQSCYRKGIQHAFIIREAIREHWGERIEVDDAFWRLMCHQPRFPLATFRTILGVSATTSELEGFQRTLSAIPVKMEKWCPVPLLDPIAGINTVEWNRDLSHFVESFRGLRAADRETFCQHLNELFARYLGAYGVPGVLRDLTVEGRVEKKVQYVIDRYFHLERYEEFEDALVEDMLSPYNAPPHQDVAPDDHNWPIDVLLIAFGLGSYQHLTSDLPRLFHAAAGHSIRPYGFMNVYGNLINYLMAGMPVGQAFSQGCPLSEPEFYDKVWPLLAECLWPHIHSGQPLEHGEICCRYRHKKAQRIISNSDLEPIRFLFRQSMPELEPGPTLRGAFNQLSTRRGWGRSSLTTTTSGAVPGTEAIVQTQSVFGRKHIADKTRELAARMRGVHLRAAEDDTFAPEQSPGTHYLVIDGDWPMESKINLYEAGFSGIFEIGELDRLADSLRKLHREP